MLGQAPLSPGRGCDACPPSSAKVAPPELPREACAVSLWFYLASCISLKGTSRVVATGLHELRVAVEAQVHGPRALG